MLVNSLDARLDYLRNSVSLRLSDNLAKRIPWFSERKENVEAQRILSSELWTKVQADFTNLLEQLRAELETIRVDNRVTLSEAVSFIGRAIRLGYEIVAKYAAKEEDRKATVLMLVDEFYNRLLAPLDIPFIPGFVENSLVDPLIGKALHYGVDGLYDVIVGALFAKPPLMASTLGSSVGSPTPVGSANPDSQ